MAHMRFDPDKLAKLDDPGRFESLKPDVMWEALGSPVPSVIVEIGAGTGLFAAKWSELSPAAVVYAADVEPRALEWMRSHRPEVSAGRVIPVASSDLHVPLDDGMADLVTMVNLHHELAHPDVMYREAHRLLACGGRLLVADWAPVDSPKGPPAEIRVTGDTAFRHLRDARFHEVTLHGGLPYHWLVTAVKR